jgi:hypothetical protein
LAISRSSCANELADLFSSPTCLAKRLLAFASSIGLGAQIRCGAAAGGEEAGEDRLDERAEDNLGAVGHGESHPEDQNEFEGVVEGCGILVTKCGVRRCTDTYGTSRQR